MRIGQLARKAAVGVETVRYYQRIGLLERPAKPHFGFRKYGDDAVGRLKFIKRAQQLGFSLEEVTELLKLSAADCTNVQALLRRKLALVRGKLADLDRMAGVLERAVKRCARRQPFDGCPIIESLSDTSR